MSRKLYKKVTNKFAKYLHNEKARKKYVKRAMNAMYI